MCRSRGGLLPSSQLKPGKLIAGSFLDLYEDLWRAQQGKTCRLGADFYSTAPPGEKAPLARFVAALVQRLLATPHLRRAYSLRCLTKDKLFPKWFGRMNDFLGLGVCAGVN